MKPCTWMKSIVHRARRGAASKYFRRSRCYVQVATCARLTRSIVWHLPERVRFSSAYYAARIHQTITARRVVGAAQGSQWPLPSISMIAGGLVPLADGCLCTRAGNIGCWLRGRPNRMPTFGLDAEQSDRQRNCHRNPGTQPDSDLRGTSVSQAIVTTPTDANLDQRADGSVRLQR